MLEPRTGFSSGATPVGARTSRFVAVWIEAAPAVEFPCRRLLISPASKRTLRVPDRPGLRGRVALLEEDIRMPSRISADHPIRELFQGLVERAFHSQLGLSDAELSRYIGDV